MVTILDNVGAQVRRIRCANDDGGWSYHSCNTCHRKFRKGNHRYEWRFKLNDYANTFWTTSCLNCVVAATNDVALSATQIRKAILE